MYPGTGQVTLTGHLGDVMKESINAGLSWIKAHSEQLGISRKPKAVAVEDSEETAESKKLDPQIFKNFDLHIHFPATAIPKDGPSAGIAITTAIVSLLTNRRVKKNFAMTGEISLQGLILPIGGVKEKCIAAHRNGIDNVILPERNRKDTADIPKDVAGKIKVHFCSRMHEVIDLALEKDIDREYLRQQMIPILPPAKL